MLYDAERWDEAQALLAELAVKMPNAKWILPAQGTLAARRGDREAALRIAEQIRQEEATRRRYPESGPYSCALIHALIGEREQAVTLLRDAFAKGLHHAVRFHEDIDLESLRGYPPYDELMRPKG